MVRVTFLLCMFAVFPVFATGNPEQVVACQVAGYDLILTNSGTETLPIGSALAWAVRFARVEGVHVLTRPLAQNERVFLVGANGSSYLTTNTPCTVELQ